MVGVTTVALTGIKGSLTSKAVGMGIGKITGNIVGSISTAITIGTPIITNINTNKKDKENIETYQKNIRDIIDKININAGGAIPNPEVRDIFNYHVKSNGVDYNVNPEHVLKYMELFTRHDFKEYEVNGEQLYLEQLSEIVSALTSYLTDELKDQSELDFIMAILGTSLHTDEDLSEIVKKHIMEYVGSDGYDALTSLVGKEIFSVEDLFQSIVDNKEEIKTQSKEIVYGEKTQADIDYANENMVSKDRDDDLEGILSKNGDLYPKWYERKDFHPILIDKMNSKGTKDDKYYHYKDYGDALITDSYYRYELVEVNDVFGAYKELAVRNQEKNSKGQTTYTSASEKEFVKYDDAEYVKEMVNNIDVEGLVENYVRKVSPAEGYDYADEIYEKHLDKSMYNNNSHDENDILISSLYDEGSSRIMSPRESIVASESYDERLYFVDSIMEYLYGGTDVIANNSISGYKKDEGFMSSVFSTIGELMVKKYETEAQYYKGKIENGIKKRRRAKEIGGGWLGEYETIHTNGFIFDVPKLKGTEISLYNERDTINNSTIMGNNENYDNDVKNIFNGIYDFFSNMSFGSTTVYASNGSNEDGNDGNIVHLENRQNNQNMQYDESYSLGSIFSDDVSNTNQNEKVESNINLLEYMELKKINDSIDIEEIKNKINTLIDEVKLNLDETRLNSHKIDDLKMNINEKAFVIDDIFNSWIDKICEGLEEVYSYSADGLYR